MRTLKIILKTTFMHFTPTSTWNADRKGRLITFGRDSMHFVLAVGNRFLPGFTVIGRYK